MVDTITSSPPNGMIIVRKNMKIQAKNNSIFIKKKKLLSVCIIISPRFTIKRLIFQKRTVNYIVDKNCQVIVMAIVKTQYNTTIL